MTDAITFDGTPPRRCSAPVVAAKPRTVAVELRGRWGGIDTRGTVALDASGEPPLLIRCELLYVRTGDITGGGDGPVHVYRQQIPASLVQVTP